jgi:hypothetical protein
LAFSLDIDEDIPQTVKADSGKFRQALVRGGTFSFELEIP